jgi:TPR repeat protein
LDKIDAEQAIPACERAVAQQALPRLQFQLGRSLEKSGNSKEAARLYKLAADQGWAVAQTGLGDLYANGQGIGQSYEEAARLYKLAADQGLAEAQTNLGALYANGQGVGQSYEEAVSGGQNARHSGDGARI